MAELFRQSPRDERCAVRQSFVECARDRGGQLRKACQYRLTTAQYHRLELLVLLCLWVESGYDFKLLYHLFNAFPNGLNCILPCLLLLFVLSQINLMVTNGWSCAPVAAQSHTHCYADHFTLLLKDSLLSLPLRILGIPWSAEIVAMLIFFFLDFLVLAAVTIVFLNVLVDYLVVSVELSPVM